MHLAVKPELESSTMRHLIQEIAILPDFEVKGKVYAIKGLLIEVSGLTKFASIGSRCHIRARTGRVVQAEVIGVRDELALLMPFGNLEGVGCGCEVVLGHVEDVIYPDLSWVGRVIDAFGNPVDGKGPLLKGPTPYHLKAPPLPAYTRKRVRERMKTGVRAVDTFLTCCRGQRMGVFAGSGVGKSMLVAMCTKFAKAEVKVVGLVGERGREVQEFLQDYLGDHGMSNAVVVVATSDEPALTRRRAAHMAMTLSEYYRDQGMHVLSMIDNITRFAMAQREIGLAAGEIPTTKGYPPSVFVELPKLLERTGPGLNQAGDKTSGDITGLFSILVEADDHNEPIADAVRGILDGHIILKRHIAERRYPAIDVLSSLSRMMPLCNSEQEIELIRKARQLMVTYEEMVDMINLGLYKPGTDPEVDSAIRCRKVLEDFLRQEPDYDASHDNIYDLLAICLEADK